MALSSRKRSWFSSIFSLAKLFEKRSEKVQRKRTTLFLEALEDRTVPAVLSYTAPDSVGSHNMVLEVVGANLEIIDNSVLVASSPKSTTTSVSISGSDAAGAITLAINYAAGAIPIPIGFDGGTGAGVHTLMLEGGSFTSEVITPTGASSGTITLDTHVITYSDLTPSIHPSLIDTSSATNLTFNGTGASGETFNIVNDPSSPENGFTSDQINGSDFAHYDFANKTNVTVAAAANLVGAGPSTITVNLTTAAAGLTKLTLDGGDAGGSTFDVKTAEPTGTSLRITGGGANNTVEGPNLADNWVITGANQGRVGSNAAANNVVTSFTSIQNLVGNNDTDGFHFSTGSTIGSIDGGLGLKTNTVFGPAGAATNLWNITGSNAGNVSSNSTSILSSFTDIQNLNGGGSGSLDTFVVGLAGALTGTIQGEPSLAQANNAIVVGPNLSVTWRVNGQDGSEIGTISPFFNDVIHNIEDVGKLQGGSLNDTFLFSNNTSSISGYINGGLGANTIINDAVLDTAGNPTTPLEFTWNITGTNSGSIGSDTNITALVTASSPPPGKSNIVKTFSNVEDLTGGSLLDVFHFASGGSVAGTITGGSGQEWLDYSAITSSVAVNLATGVAPFTGAVSNVNNVIGSAGGGDTLTGDAAGGVLIGHNNTVNVGNIITAGAGRSIIVGGTGSDVTGKENQLTGGTQDDILIDGRTVYDADPTALGGLLTEWQSAATFAARVAALQTGIVVSGAGTVKLVVNDSSHPAGTVFLSTAGIATTGPRYGHSPGGTGSATVLTGGAGSNWFFTVSINNVTNFKTGDVLTSS